MYPKYLSNIIVYSHEPALKAFYKLCNNELGKIVLVLNEEHKMIGTITLGDFKEYSEEKVENTNSGEICNKNYKYIRSNTDVYLHGRNIFSQNIHINAIPVLDESNMLVDILYRWQAEYSSYLQQEKLAYMQYAKPIAFAGYIASKYGYKKISIIEFGVAGGNGLVMCELHAKEIERMFGLEIDIYGFDSGQGLPKLTDYRDVPQDFKEGLYKMDIEKLQNRLRKAKLVIGDINDTCKTFLEEYNPAPIACVMIDVDLYQSTKSILNMFKGSDDYFLPIVCMYFDDVHQWVEFQGEYLALKEFNKENEYMKISPENFYGFESKFKQLHRFKHSKYNNFIGVEQSLRLKF